MKSPYWIVWAVSPDRRSFGVRVDQACGLVLQHVVRNWPEPLSMRAVKREVRHVLRRARCWGVWLDRREGSWDCFTCEKAGILQDFREVG